MKKLIILPLLFLCVECKITTVVEKEYYCRYFFHENLGLVRKETCFRVYRDTLYLNGSKHVIINMTGKDILTRDFVIRVEHSDIYFRTRDEFPSIILTSCVRAE